MELNFEILSFRGIYREVYGYKYSDNRSYEGVERKFEWGVVIFVFLVIVFLNLKYEREMGIYELG